MSTSIIMLIASEGFQPIEYSVPKRIFEQAGFMVTTASDKPGQAIAADKSTVRVDLTFDKVNTDHFSAVILVGGPGALDHMDNQTVHAIVKSAQKEKKPLGAICIAPRILARAGALKGKRATGWDGDGELANVFKEYGVTYEHRPVVVDGLIVTASGPQASREFATKLIERLSR